MTEYHFEERDFLPVVKKKTYSAKKEYCGVNLGLSGIGFGRLFIQREEIKKLSEKNSEGFFATIFINRKDNAIKMQLFADNSMGTRYHVFDCHGGKSKKDRTKTTPGWVISAHPFTREELLAPDSPRGRYILIQENIENLTYIFVKTKE